MATFWSGRFLRPCVCGSYSSRMQPAHCVIKLRCPNYKNKSYSAARCIYSSCEREIRLALEKSNMNKRAKTTPEPVSTVSARAIQPNKDDGDEKSVKPPYSYAALISMSIKASPEKRLTKGGICEYLTKTFPYFRNSVNHGWRNSVGNCLALHDCFMKLPAKGGENGKSHYWVLDPHQGRNYCRRRRRPVKSVAYFPASWTRGHHPGTYSHVGADFSHYRPTAWPTMESPMFQPYSALPAMNVDHNHYATSIALQSPSTALHANWVLYTDKPPPRPAR